jgi:hypothetical protein
MPGVYDIRADEPLVECTFSGPTSPADCLRVIDQILADPRYREDFPCLIDNRDIAGAFTRADIDQVIPAVARALAGMTARPRVAIVVSRDVQYGLGRMFQALTGNLLNLDLRVFRDRAEAAAWLGGAHPR